MSRLETRLLTALFLFLAVGLSAQETAPLLLREALELARAGDLTAAVSRLEELRATGEAPPRALGTLGALYLETGRPQMALTVLGPLANLADADPAVLYNAGRAAAALGDDEPAARFLLRSLQQEPGSPATRELGLLLGRRGRDEESYLYLRPWALRNLGDTEARLAAAVLAVRLERASDAEELLSDLPQDEAGVRFLWGQVLLLRGDPWGALGYLKPLQVDPPPAIESDLRRSLAKAYLAVGEAALAIEVLEGWVGENPGVALQLSQAQYESADLDAALTTLGPFALPLLEMPPVSLEQDAAAPQQLAVEVVIEYGRLLLTAGRQEEAMPFLRLATSLAPERQQVWQALGQALAAVGKQEEARAALARFQEIMDGKQQLPLMDGRRDLEDPSGAAIRRAMKHLREGEVEAALEILGRESQLAPEDPRLPMAASRVLFLNEQPEQALGAADRAVFLAPESPDAYYQKGVVLMFLQRLEEAEVELREALELDPGHIPAMSDLAILLDHAGSTDEARKLLERVIELRPEDSLARQNLERLRGGSEP